MSLDGTYPPDFERIWKAYPDWPKGRSKKHLAYKKWVQVRKEEELSDSDVNTLIGHIDEAKRTRKSWQRGDTYGPQGLQVWLNQRGWRDEYEATKRDKYERGPRLVHETHEDALRKIEQARQKWV